MKFFILLIFIWLLTGCCSTCDTESQSPSLGDAPPASLHFLIYIPDDKT